MYVFKIVFLIAFLLPIFIFAKQEFYGDLRGTPAQVTVVKVGEQTASNVAQGVKLANSSTSDGTPNTLVKRDDTGNFITNQINLTGTPIDDTHTVTKTYVDNAINNVLDQISQHTQLTIPTNGGIINVNSDTEILILKNTSNVAGYTINFPAHPTDKQFFMILLGTSNNVTGIINSTTDGASIVNGVTSLTPTDLIITDGGASVSYFYSLAANTWYRCQRG
jgi:hypothetical protein